MRFALIRNAILEKEKDILDKDLRKKLLPANVVEARLNGLEICRKIKRLKELDSIIEKRQKEEIKVAKKGNPEAYWRHRYATIEALKVRKLLEGATSTKAKVGKRVAKELVEAMGDER